MRALRLLAFAATAMMASSTLASAQEAFTTADVNMRAGPSTRYPVVTTVPDNREVFVHGCIANWDWCDVSWRRNRGWVFSDNLEFLYRNRRVSIYDYRGYVDLPVVTFGFGYWDRYYRDRPWFGDWDHWHLRIRDRDRDRDWDGDRDRDRDRDRDWNKDRDWDRDRTGDRDRDGDRTEERDGDQAQGDRVIRRDRDDMQEEDAPRRRRGSNPCAGPNPDPSCGND